MDQHDTIWAFLTIVAFIAGVLTAAWISEDEHTRLRAQVDHWRRIAHGANGRAAHNAQKAEHARAEIEWRGGYQ